MSERARQASGRSLQREGQADASKKTVYVAIAANGFIALAKLGAGLATGSAAMLAEAAHSVADTTNQGFLLVSIALGGRRPTPEQPFGYGQERFLWTFMAAIGMFLAGATFAIGFGAYELVSREGEDSGFAIAYVVLAVAFVAEGISWLRALRQSRGEARDEEMRLFDYLRQSRDPNVKMVLFEDTAALIGVLLAAAGITLNAVTGAVVWDPIASVVIGFLLVSVAVWMARDTRHLLVGASARPHEREAIERTIEGYEEVDRVVEVLTMALGPNALLVAARIDFRDDLNGTRLEEVSTEIDRELRRTVPDVTEVFLDATPSRREEATLHTR